MSKSTAERLKAHLEGEEVTPSANETSAYDAETGEVLAEPDPQTEVEGESDPRQVISKISISTVGGNPSAAKAKKERVFLKSALLLTALCLAIVAVAPGQSRAANLTSLVSFNGTNGGNPIGGLIADANGNLFGTTEGGGAYEYGTVFEIANTAGGYASTPTTLVSFNGTNGARPFAGLIADADGNLFGTTNVGGGPQSDGTVFEIAKTAGGYASTPTTLVSFNGTNGETPVAGLIADAKGNLFGTTPYGGAYGLGTVFEIAKTARGYASTPTTLVSFNGTDGQILLAGLIADANGNLFGTTEGINAVGYNVFGTVFEIAKTAGGYASTPTTLFSFNGTNGAYRSWSMCARTTPFGVSSPGSGSLG